MAEYQTPEWHPAFEEYIRPVGGGFFFCPPGVETADGFLGEGMFRT